MLSPDTCGFRMAALNDARKVSALNPRTVASQHFRTLTFELYIDFMVPRAFCSLEIWLCDL